MQYLMYIFVIDLFGVGDFLTKFRKNSTLQEKKEQLFSV
jgi:hypothetical protein